MRFGASVLVIKCTGEVLRCICVKLGSKSVHSAVPLPPTQDDETTRVSKKRQALQMATRVQQASENTWAKLTAEWMGPHRKMIDVRMLASSLFVVMDVGISFTLPPFTWSAASVANACITCKQSSPISTMHQPSCSTCRCTCRLEASVKLTPKWQRHIGMVPGQWHDVSSHTAGPLYRNIC